MTGSTLFHLERKQSDSMRLFSSGTVHNHERYCEHCERESV